MKKNSAFVFVLSFIFCVSPMLHAAFFSMPLGKSKPQLVLNSDRQHKPRKKKKEKKNTATNIQSRVTQWAQTVRSLGSQAKTYATSEKGKEQIVSVMKYAVPVAICGVGFKYLADKNQQAFQVLREYFSQQAQQLQQLQQENQQLHQQAMAAGQQRDRVIAQVGQQIHNNTALIVQVQNRVNNAATADQVRSLNQVVNAIGEPLARTQQNLNQLHQYLQAQQRAAVNADVGSPDDAECVFKEVFYRSVLIDLQTDTDKFEIGSAQQLVGNDNRIYKVVPVEVKVKISDRWFGLSRSYQKTWELDNGPTSRLIKEALGNDTIIVPYAIENGQVQWLER